MFQNGVQSNVDGLGAMWTIRQLKIEGIIRTKLDFLRECLSGD